MKIKKLRKKLQELEDDGYGSYDIFVEGVYADSNYIIDSVQKNTNPNVKPNYFFIMVGEPQEES